MNQLLTRFQQQWNKQFNAIPLKHNRFLIAFSGGLDSVVLAHLMQQSEANCRLAHCNFQLRGTESKRDEAFVQQYAASLNLPLSVIHFDTDNYAKEHKLSIQEAARNLRYNWFKTIKDEHAIQWLLTAHHADDNIETVLMHFFRGTGIKGLTGIPFLQKEQSIIRPLLPFHKAELAEYAAENNLGYVEDSSNKKEEYTRNFFRLNLIPQIKNIYPQVEENILQNIQRFTEANMVYETVINFHKKKLLTFKGNEVHIPVLLLKKMQPLSANTWEIIKDYGFQAAQTDEVIKLMDAHTGSYILSGSHRIILNRKWLLIVPNNQQEAIHIQIEEQDNIIHFSKGQIFIDKIVAHANYNVPTDANVACIDAKEVKYPLLLRPWKQGDYFYPLGMTKKKKLSRFFIDQKLSLTDKENAMVIESAGRIIWIVGRRIDNRFKINNKSKNIIQIRFLEETESK